ncbi:MAG: dTDP-4-dehydrorhamnose reductase [Lachnospiraceae bacterium]|jgi:dTDP-4-dehydrorhamnose reductase|nr:dTDP-4-dehydrorhamnose reductase [Lachnospiraceae bacterium]MBR3575310.1 dTDP-4-dehydrorhamnose reductase [Lachnospiraceae bacterium]
MKVLVTGVNGQLGHDLMNELARRNIESVGSDITPQYSGIKDGSAAGSAAYVQMDITDRDGVLDTIRNTGADVVMHCAAWTAVDAAEDEANRDKVYAVNAKGTDHIAEACRECDAKMLYLSTDYVFNGEGTEAWDPDCKDYAPLNYYGETKLEGEKAVSSRLEKYFIVRIAWVFGLNGKNFIKTMLGLADTHDSLRVVDDQIGTPTYTYDLAVLLVDMILTEKYGYYHATNEGGYISWADFAEAIMKEGGKSTVINRVTTEEYGLSKAKRPFNSRLDKSKLVKNGFTPLPDWKDALHRYLIELKSVN